jgi:hypothetical protein
MEMIRIPKSIHERIVELGKRSGPSSAVGSWLKKEKPLKRPSNFRIQKRLPSGGNRGHLTGFKDGVDGISSNGS